MWSIESVKTETTEVGASTLRVGESGDVSYFILDLDGIKRMGNCQRRKGPYSPKKRFFSVLYHRLDWVLQW